MVKVEFGKYYRRRDGQIVGPIERDLSSEIYPYSYVIHEEHKTVMRDGSFFADRKECISDLIEEVDNEPARVGDLVLVELTVTEYNGDTVRFSEAGGYSVKVSKIKQVVKRAPQIEVGSVVTMREGSVWNVEAIVGRLAWISQDRTGSNKIEPLSILKLTGPKNG